MLDAISGYAFRSLNPFKRSKLQKPLYSNRQRNKLFDDLATQDFSRFSSTAKLGVFSTVDGIAVLEVDRSDIPPVTLVLFYRDSQFVERYQYDRRGRLFIVSSGEYETVNIFGVGKFSNLPFTEGAIPRGDAILSGLSDDSRIDHKEFYR